MFPFSFKIKLQVSVRTHIYTSSKMYTMLDLEPNIIVWTIEIKPVLLILEISASSVFQNSTREYLSYHENFLL